jgi:hypothetical protein
MQSTFRVTALARIVGLGAVLMGGGACGSVRAIDGDAGTGGGGGGGVGTGGTTTSGGDAAADTAPEVAPPLTADAACALTANAICDAIDACASFILRLQYGDKATCVSRTTLSCTGDQAVPGTTRTVDDLASCARDVGAAACPALLAGEYPPACALKPGTRVNGMPCGSDWQCASTYCRKTGACGTCAPRVDAGEACVADGGCEKGLVCATMKCVAPGSVGAACSASQPCRGDLYCKGGASGVCAAKLGASGSCADPDRAACDVTQGVACNLLGFTCQPVTVARGGDACGIVNGAFTLCVGLNPCPGLTPLQWMGVCANPAADGTACGAAAGDTRCVPPAECQQGICRLPSAQTCN